MIEKIRKIAKYIFIPVDIVLMLLCISIDLVSVDFHALFFDGVVSRAGALYWKFDAFITLVFLLVIAKAAIGLIALYITAIKKKKKKIQHFLLLILLPLTMALVIIFLNWMISLIIILHIILYLGTPFLIFLLFKRGMERPVDNEIILYAMMVVFVLMQFLPALLQAIMLAITLLFVIVSMFIKKSGWRSLVLITFYGLVSLLCGSVIVLNQIGRFFA
jgi:hypothetical protein